MTDNVSACHVPDDLTHSSVVCLRNILRTAMTLNVSGLELGSQHGTGMVHIDWECHTERVGVAVYVDDHVFLCEHGQLPSHSSVFASVCIPHFCAASLEMNSLDASCFYLACPDPVPLEQDSQ